MRYRTLNSYLKERFGCKVYKLALDGGMTCPNRDGTLGTRGCIFCSRSGSGDFAVCSGPDITAQLAAARRVVAGKVKQAKYIAYFQSFTNTYAPAYVLEPLYRAAMAPEEVVALSIATRPDCIPDDVLALLCRLNARKPVWIELGLQTIHPASAAYIRRGYDLACYDACVERLRAAGLEVITHMILGLPFETPRMMYETAAYIGKSGVQGIKLQLLHVLRDADLAEEYAAGAFPTLTLEKYAELLAGCIRRLPKDMVIHRLTGDGAKRNLIAPLWSADKKRVLNRIQAYFEQEDVRQGALWSETGLFL
ncbi:MAG: TIGR01212 family radical SAM protein [Clostridiaceae bacterium]|nr:TIGR01212 family radical SAM protein [Clostridiaceae bacterium]